MKEIDIAGRDIQLYKIIFLFNLQCECFKQNYLNISTVILTRPLFSQLNISLYEIDITIRHECNEHE